jgi:hypothetical protein
MALRVVAGDRRVHVYRDGLARSMQKPPRLSRSASPSGPSSRGRRPRRSENHFMEKPGKPPEKYVVRLKLGTPEKKDEK